MSEWLTRIGCVVALVLLLVAAWLLESDWLDALDEADRED